MITVEEILLEWKADSEIGKNLDEETLRCARLHRKYLEILSAVKVQLKKRKRKLETVKHEKKLWLHGRMSKDDMDKRGWKYDPFDGSKPMKSEYDGYIKVDPDVQDLIDDIETLNICHDTLVDILDNIKWRPQSIKNAIEFKKFLAGN